MGYSVEILRGGRRESAIHEDEIEAVIGGKFGFSIERDQRGAIARMRKTTERGEIVMMYEPPASITIENPGMATLQLLIEIAGALGKGARVRNDEYQTYLTVDQTYTHPHDAEQFKLQKTDTPLQALEWRDVLAKAPKVLLLLAVCYFLGKFLLAHVAK